MTLIDKPSGSIDSQVDFYYWNTGLKLSAVATSMNRNPMLYLVHSLKLSQQVIIVPLITTEIRLVHSLVSKGISDNAQVLYKMHHTSTNYPLE